MEISELSKLFWTSERSAAVKDLLGRGGARVAAMAGLAGSAVAMALAGLPKRKQPYLVVANDLDEAGYLYHDLAQLMSEQDVLVFPSGYKRDIKYGQIDAPNEILRTEVLNRWYARHAPRWVVTFPEALAEQVASRETIEQTTVELSRGDTQDITDLANRLGELGFSRVDYVYEPGQFAVRGSIVDVFSFSNEMPYRIDFFGDEIDSIRTFNVETQLSEVSVEAIGIVGNNGSQTSTGTSLLDYIQPATVLVCHDAAWLVTRIREIAKSKIAGSAVIAAEGDLNAMDKVIDPDHFEDVFYKMRRLDYSTGQTVTTAAEHDTLTLHCAPQGIYHKNFDLISTSLTEFLNRDYQLFILSDNPKQIERLRVIFADRGDQIAFQPVNRTLHEGFVDHDNRLCVFTDHQIFDRFHKYNLKSERARSGKLALSLRELNQIEIGDFIVHEDHGIGKFGGLVRMPVNGTMHEMIKLTYLGGDTVFVSIHGLHKLAKYKGREGEQPRLHKLGSGAWARLKSRTKSRLKDIARDLIRLYAQRRQEQGFAFSPDGYLQQELEASFIYEDTPDQLRATQAVKADMERNQPMDRLICGDVGFGKTEIAIRAAFKAATDGKQTAVLVPTTVLAFQHFNTFTDRLRDFPVRVDYLSRARKPKEIKQILADLADGKIDIIIGTHKIVGKSVKFHDLGLLVIDEEQKFGVATKEKLKQLRVNVDTLTMSATPIPRTLQFSLMGARDLSAINTPPPNRYPILTQVSALDDQVVAEAINFELSRNGQVFFVNNRIEQLYNLQHLVNRVVPDARTVVAHGQMPPEKMEQIIIDFANHDYDVLLSTTIIESGIDMPNVNTIIINNAHNYGLSDLHQLRGRVGRSSRKAFCYLLVPAGKPLTTTARRRLQAIESFSDLGAGIHIAMQDLDIRGAGNLLGAEQSGFIADLGYETYQKILREAVTELRAEEFADQLPDLGTTDAANDEFAPDCTVDTDLELMFPYDYVPQENERITLYRELDSLRSESQVDVFKQHMVDRFGPLPHVAEELIKIVPLRQLARQLGIVRINLKMGSMYLYFVGEENSAYYQSPSFGRILHFAQNNPQITRMRQREQQRSFVITPVKSVERALHILRIITTLEPL